MFFFFWGGGGDQHTFQISNQNLDFGFDGRCYFSLINMFISWVDGRLLPAVVAFIKLLRECPVPLKM